MHGNHSDEVSDESVYTIERRTKTLTNHQFANIDFDGLIQVGEPCILKNALSNCPLVLTGKRSDNEAIAHLLSHASDHPVLNYVAGAEAKTRFFYNKQMNGLNFTTEFIDLTTFFEKLKADRTAQSGKAFYVGSADLVKHFPNLIKGNGLQLQGETFNRYPARVGIWLGNKTTAAAHYDVSNNIAACMVGRRRFTLFPPEQAKNLYPGPLEPTPGGQVVSMFNLSEPDFTQFPKARTALAHAEVAELEAGDVLVYPAMWWHQVEALDPFNVMINYWWNTVASYIDDPMTTLFHALMSLRDRPEHEKKAWRNLFDFYVFDEANNTREHLPEHIWGALAPMDETTARRLRVKLLKKLNR